MHDIFIEHVKSRRGDKLAEGVDFFTGDVWIGKDAVEKGLVDGIGHLVPKMKERFGDKVRFAVYGQRRRMFQRFGMSILQDAADMIQERAAFARFGL